MRLLRKKARRDLFGSRGRIATVFLAMVLGTTVFGSITFTRAIINRELDVEYESTVPASASILVDRVDDKLIELLEASEEVADYEIGAAHELTMVRSDDIVKKLQLFSSESFEEKAINKITSVEGSFAPDNGEILLESDAQGVADAGLGDDIEIRLPDDTVQSYHISGLVNDLSQHPPSMHNEVYAYVLPDTLAEMGLSMNRIDYLISGDAYDRTQILEVTQVLIAELQGEGYQVLATQIADHPGVSMHRDEYRGALFIFQAFSIVAFLFGGIIMSSLFGTILSGQVKQIGVLKSMGAGTGSVILSYLGAAAILILANAIVSLPLSVLAARGMAAFFMSIGNMMVHNYGIPWYLLLIFGVAGLLVPFLLALLPIRRGLSITVKEALNDTGVTVHGKQKQQKKKGNGWLERTLSRPVLSSLRGAMENRRRFTMNVAMLALGGLMFVGVLGTILSINTALSRSIRSRQYDYQITTGSYVEDEVLAAVAESQENVDDYEIWGVASGQLVYEDGSTGNTLSFLAVPEDGKLYEPELMEGRWLEPGDNTGIVVSFEFLDQEPEYQLGSTVSFRFGNQVQELQIVGVVYEVGDSSIYINREGMEDMVPEMLRRSSICMATEGINARRSAQYHVISEHFTDGGITVLQASSRMEQYKVLKSHFTTTLTSFLIVAILAVVIAAFGLAATMQVQVQKRTREIGILKAVGANRRQVYSIITAEGTFTAVVSFAICLALGIPFAILAVWVIGNVILELPLAPSPWGIALALVIWLVLILIVGRLSSRRAAKKAARLTVKESLHMEG